MTDFEQWLQTTPEYKNLLIQHGERLFIMRNGEYEILTVRLAHRAYEQNKQQPVNHCNHYFVNNAKTLNKTQCIKCGEIKECEHQWEKFAHIRGSLGGSLYKVEYEQCKLCREIKNDGNYTTNQII